MTKFVRYVSIIIVSVSLAACASGANPLNMTASPDSTYQLAPSNHFYESVGVKQVSGGKKTNPLLASKVSNEAFHKALEKSLQEYHLLSTDGNPKYLVDAELIALDQPIIGFSFDVVSVVDYKVTKESNDSVVFDKQINAKGTATMGDSLIGPQRLRLANELSIKNNLKSFLDALAQ